MYSAAVPECTVCMLTSVPNWKGGNRSTAVLQQLSDLTAPYVVITTRNSGSESMTGKLSVFVARNAVLGLMTLVVQLDIYKCVCTHIYACVCVYWLMTDFSS